MATVFLAAAVGLYWVTGLAGEAPTGGGTSGGETSGTTGAVGCPERAPWGMWVWQPEQAKDPGKAAQLLEFAAAHEVTHLYLESEALLVEDPERLMAFIGEADAACVAVELLFGAAAWAQAEHHAEPLALIEDALALVEGVAGPRPVGLHFDIEPHGLPDWDVDPQGYASEYLDLLEAMAANMMGSELSVTVDIALTCGIEAEKVTFCEEGAIAMFLALKLTASIYAASPAWDGVAVHDHAAWSVLMD